MLRRVVPPFGGRLLLLLVSTVVCPAVGVPWGATIALGQPAIEAALERHGPVLPEKRTELYRQLGSQAEFFERQSEIVKSAARLVAPTVVHIEADVVRRDADLTRRPAMRMAPNPTERQVEENGSGVVIELRGRNYVLTSRHVIAGAQPAAIKINLADGRRIFPEKVLEDRETDVAILPVTAANLVAARLGNSDPVEIGDFVLAIGNPFGLTHSVTFGIVSAKGRRNLELGDSGIRLQDFLQTDAAINPGNSGGPLINLRGEVIGINTCIASNSGGNEGIGFAIPINMFMFVAKQLTEQGKFARAFLGVTMDRTFGTAMAVEVGLPRPIGARVIKVYEKSPAAAAGLREGDVILQFDQIAVENDAHLSNLVKLTAIGKRVKMLVFRERQTVQIEAKLVPYEVGEE